MARKARSDSRITKLAPAIRAELARMLAEDNKSFDEAVAWLKSEHGVKIGRTAVRNWFTLHSWRENAEQARATANQVTDLAQANDSYDAATLALIREKAYILARTPGADVGDLVSLAGVVGDSVKLRLKEREVTVSERRVAILEAKAAKADEAEGVVKDETLTDEQRQAKLRQIFRMG